MSTTEEVMTPEELQALIASCLSNTVLRASAIPFISGFMRLLPDVPKAEAVVYWNKDSELPQTAIGFDPGTSTQFAIVDLDGLREVIVHNPQVDMLLNFMVQPNKLLVNMSSWGQGLIDAMKLALTQAAAERFIEELSAVELDVECLLGGYAMAKYARYGYVQVPFTGTGMQFFERLVTDQTNTKEIHEFAADVVSELRAYMSQLPKSLDVDAVDQHIERVREAVSAHMAS
jgi:hypothetical protein